MSQAIPTQHPAVVLRSHYKQLRMVLAIAMIAVVGLTVAVVVLATNDDGGASASSARTLNAPTQAAAIQRFDVGRPDEGTRGPLLASSSPTTRFDVGRPDEGTRGPGH